MSTVSCFEIERVNSFYKNDPYTPGRSLIRCTQIIRDIIHLNRFCRAVSLIFAKLIKFKLTLSTLSQTWDYREKNLSLIGIELLINLYTLRKSDAIEYTQL